MQEGPRDKVLQAWDSRRFSGDSLDVPFSEEDGGESRGSRLLYGACQLLLGGQAVVLALFASHVDGAEHALFYVCDALVAVLFVVYSVLRCSGLVGPASMAPVCAVFAWALSLLLSLSAQGRRRRLLGLEDLLPDEPCEEGSAALWIAMLLSLLPVLSPMPVAPFAFLGQLVSLQHLVIGLLLPRQECSREAGGPGGATLGLPPIWVSAFQLSALSALLVAGHWRTERHRQAENVLSRFLNNRSSTRADMTEFGSSHQLAQNQLERIVNELEREEQDCRRLVRELDEVLPLSSSASGGLWASLPLHMASMLKRCTGQLKKHNSDGDNATDQLFRAMEGTRGHEAAAVSGWLEQSWTQQGFNPRVRRSSIARDERSEHVNLVSLASVDEEEMGRRLSRSTTVVGLAAEWGIGDWEFDALKCEQDHHHVLQTVGFELLRSYSVLPRPQLGAFLERVERTYVAGNPYHSHVHGADMTNALFYLVSKTELWSIAEIADSTRAATLIAALGHDVGHFSRNNLFLISSRHKLAVTYNDRSILENFHSATLMRLLDEEYGEPENKKKLLSEMTEDHLKKARNLMITLILGTDPQKHLDDLSAFRMRIGASSFDPVSDDSDWQMCLSMLFRAADIGHSAKEWPLHQEWSRRVVQEFHGQGDEEKLLGLKVSPLCDREGFQLLSSQVGFLQFICLPTWTEIAQLEHRLKEQQCMGASFGQNARGSRRSSTVSSVGSALRSPTGSRVSSPRTTSGNAVSSPTPNLQRRNSVGALLSGAARSTTQFLLLPGAMPSTPSAKETQVAPAADFMMDQTPLGSRCIRDVCLANCESNKGHWKAMASSTSNTDLQTEHVPPAVPGTASSSPDLDLDAQEESAAKSESPRRESSR